MDYLAVAAGACMAYGSDFGSGLKQLHLGVITDLV